MTLILMWQLLVVAGGVALFVIIFVPPRPVWRVLGRIALFGTWIAVHGAGFYAFVAMNYCEHNCSEGIGLPSIMILLGIMGVNVSVLLFAWRVNRHYRHFIRAHENE